MSIHLLNPVFFKQHVKHAPEEKAKINFYSLNPGFELKEKKRTSANIIRSFFKQHIVYKRVKVRCICLETANILCLYYDNGVDRHMYL